MLKLIDPDQVGKTIADRILERVPEVAEAAARAVIRGARDELADLPIIGALLKVSR